MSSVTSTEPTAQQNFNPSWMRSTGSANRGGFGGRPTAGGGGGGPTYDEGGEDQSAVILSTPIISEYSYTREQLLKLVPTGSVMPEALREQLFFSENNLPLVSSTPLSDLEQRLQSNINSSKAMSQLSATDRASIASGAAYGSGYGGPGGALQNGQSPNRWVNKSWSKTTPDRSLGGSSTRGGGSVGRASGSYFAGRGGGRIGGDNGFGGANGTSGGGAAEEGSGGVYQPKFSALRRGGGAGGVGRGGSTSGASFNTRADALYNPNDPTDRPKAVGSTVTRSDSDDDDDGEGGWSKVGATRHSSSTASNSVDRPAWARSESWLQRSDQQRQIQQQQSQNSPASQQQAPISHWNNRDADSSVWKDRNQMVASVKKNSTEHPPAQQQHQPAQSAAPTSSQEAVAPAQEVPIEIPAYAPNSSTWSMGGGGGIFYQPSIQTQPVIPVPVVKEEPIEFYYMDPTETRRGPFLKDQMEAWFKAGYFSDETLRVQRGENGEFKTIGDLKKQNGATTPFEYPEDIEKSSPPRAVSQPPPAAVMNPYAQVAANPMFPMAGMGMWSGMGQSAEMYTLMQSSFEQQMNLERQRLLEEHKRHVAEEAKKLAEFQEAMYRQMTIQQEMSNLQLREQEAALQRHREELERRDMEIKQEALAKKHEMEQKARQLEEQQAALEAEARRKRQIEEHKIRAEEQQREAAAREDANRARRAEEAAEKERLRLEIEARQAEETIRQLKLKHDNETKAKVEEARRKAEEKERLAKEAAAARAQAEADAVWTQKPTVTTSSSATSGPKQVSPSASDDSEGWTSINKEVKHTKAAPWAAKVEAPVKSEKTLLEIQLEEERQMKAEREQLAKQKTKEQAANLGSAAALKEEKTASWGGSKTWGTPDQGSSAKSYVSPFFDGPSLETANKMQLQKKNSQPKMAVPTAKPATPIKTKATPVKATPPTSQKKKTKQETAAEEFEAWFVKRFSQAAPHVDAPTLYTCILDLENPNEVEDIVMSYLDESKTVKEFVREFIKRRIAMRAAGGATRPDVDDLTSARTASAAPSDSNSGSNSNSGNGQGKKKKKNQKAVFDSNILGFRGAAASDRLNKGEIDAIPSTPVNPSRR